MIRPRQFQMLEYHPVTEYIEGTVRHTCIKNSIYASVNPKTIQYLAVHENSKITMDIYVKVKYNKLKEL